MTSDNSDAWDTGSMAEALNETSIEGKKEITFANPVPSDKNEAKAKAKEHGWEEPVPYNYAVYNGSADRATDNLNGDIEHTVTFGESRWLSQAAVYEFDDEYGEVGPRNPALEQELYHDENRMITGEHVHQFQYQVHTAGPVMINHITEASKRENFGFLFGTLMVISLPMPVFILL
jgi:hypothetical protein